MAIRKCIVGSDNVVANVIALPDEWEAGNSEFWQPPKGFRLVDQGESGQIGATLRQDGGFDDPPSPEPPPVDKTLARVAALEKTVQAFVDNDIIAREKLPDEIKGRITEKPKP